MPSLLFRELPRMTYIYSANRCKSCLIFAHFNATIEFYFVYNYRALFVTKKNCFPAFDPDDLKQFVSIHSCASNILAGDLSCYSDSLAKFVQLKSITFQNRSRSTILTEKC